MASISIIGHWISITMPLNQPIIYELCNYVSVCNTSIYIVCYLNHFKIPPFAKLRIRVFLDTVSLSEKPDSNKVGVFLRHMRTTKKHLNSSVALEHFVQNK